MKVYKNGRYWVCSNKAKAAGAAWRQANPGRTAANRKTVSAHHLTSRDLKSMTGECPICGPVYIVAYGRGYACGNRASQLRFAQEQSTAERCWKCQAWASVDNPVFEGVCDRCERLLQPGATIAGWSNTRPHTVESLREARWYLECEEAGIHIGYPNDPYDVDDHQPVPGWKTIGSPLPTR